MHVGDSRHECRRPDGTAHGPVIIDWSGLEGESAWIIGSNLDGKQHGPWYTYTRRYGMDGPQVRIDRPFLSEVVEYWRGTEHGRSIRYATPQHYREEKRFFHGKRHGVWRWYRQGKLRGSRTYRHGRRHGLEIHYDKYSEASERAVYCDGELEGKLENGKLIPLTEEQASDWRYWEP